MKKLLNTLYVMSENGYLSLDGENVVLGVYHCTIWKELFLLDIEGRVRL